MKDMSKYELHDSSSRNIFGSIQYYQLDDAIDQAEKTVANNWRSEITIVEIKPVARTFRKNNPVVTERIA